MVKFDVAGQLTVRQRVELLKLPPAKRKRLTGQIARKVRVASRKRLRQQRDLKGAPWEPRKGRQRRKMLSGMGKLMTAKGTAKEATVTFKNSPAGRIARAHQEGHNEIMTARKMARIHGEPDYEAPATRSQAKALKSEGYKVRKASGKGYKNATIKAITDTLTLGQAGIILRLMRDKEQKTSWVIPLPARSFLGATETEINDMVQTVFDQTINAPTSKRG